jgi:hypothetical protein
LCDIESTHNFEFGPFSAPIIAMLTSYAIFVASILSEINLFNVFSVEQNHILKSGKKYNMIISIMMLLAASSKFYLVEFKLFSHILCVLHHH